MDAAKISELKHFIEQCKSNPSILNDPSHAFFRNYLHSLGARIPPATKMEKGDIDMSEFSEYSDVKKPPEEGDDEIVESDIELDDTDVVEPDNDPPQKLSDSAVEVTEEEQEAAQAEKLKAMDAIAEGKLDEALHHQTEAIMLNPTSAILYGTRASVFVRLKKPNAAIRDANAALEQYNFQISNCYVLDQPDSAKGYEVRGMARAILGQWEGTASDLHVASKLDYDEEIGLFLKKVEPNAHKIEEHRKKYARLRKQKELKKVERKRKRQAEAQEREALSALKEGQVIGIHSAGELDNKLSAASRASRLAILYFTASWCGPCRFISPLFTSLATKHPKAVFLKIDIDEARDAAARWNISSVPTFFFIENGKEIDKVVGADKNALESKIQQHAG